MGLSENERRQLSALAPYLDAWPWLNALAQPFRQLTYGESTPEEHQGTPVFPGDAAPKVEGRKLTQKERPPLSLAQLDQLRNQPRDALGLRRQPAEKYPQLPHRHKQHRVGVPDPARDNGPVHGTVAAASQHGLLQDVRCCSRQGVDLDRDDSALGPKYRPALLRAPR